jgi:aspartate/methionine/tyrosine aminotransferase
MREVYGRSGAEVDVTEENVAVTAGCNLNMAYVAGLTTLADPGDEIILPMPWCVLRFFIIATSLS